MKGPADFGLDQNDYVSSNIKSVFTPEGPKSGAMLFGSAKDNTRNELTLVKLG